MTLGSGALASFTRQIVELQSEVERLKARLNKAYIPVDDSTDISTPPTDAELDSIFGTPDSRREGFVAIVIDSGNRSNVFLVASVDSKWFYEQLTEAS